MEFTEIGEFLFVSRGCPRSFLKINYFLPSIRPYSHKTFQKDLFISFGVTQNTDRQTDRQMNKDTNKHILSDGGNAKHLIFFKCDVKVTKSTYQSYSLLILHKGVLQKSPEVTFWVACFLNRTTHNVIFSMIHFGGALNGLSL